MAGLGVQVVRLALREPLTASWGSLAARELVQVQLLFSDSDRGIGEAAALEPYDGVPLAAVLAALDAYGAVLADADPEDSAESLLAACRAERPLPQALAAIDLALWDRAGRRAGRSVATLLSPAAAGAVAVNALVGAEDRAGAARAAGAAAVAGFGCVKVKVGVGDEPVHGVEALRAVRAESPVPVAMDETAAEPGAAASGAADAVCLKIARCGGISALLREAEAARAAGSAVYVASSLDGPLGIAAGLHAAAALAATGPVAACGLATLGLFADLDPVLVPRDGAIALPSGPGLL